MPLLWWDIVCWSSSFGEAFDKLYERGLVSSVYFLETAWLQSDTDLSDLFSFMNCAAFEELSPELVEAARAHCQLIVVSKWVAILLDCGLGFIRNSLGFRHSQGGFPPWCSLPASWTGSLLRLWRLFTLDTNFPKSFLPLRSGDHDCQLIENTGGYSTSMGVSKFLVNLTRVDCWFLDALAKMKQVYWAGTEGHTRRGGEAAARGTLQSVCIVSTYNTFQWLSGNWIFDRYPGAPCQGSAEGIV
jgi:hypothetical protein